MSFKGVSEIKEIVFCFENLEQITVPMEEVEYINFLNVHKDLSSHQKMLREMTCAGEAFVMLKRTAETKAVSTFGDTPGDESKFSGPKFFERLAIYRDCVGIDIIFAEKEERLEIYIPWEDDGDEYTNKMQETFWQNSDELIGKGCFCVHFGLEWKTFPNPVDSK